MIAQLNHRTGDTCDMCDGFVCDGDICVCGTVILVRAARARADVRT